MLVSNQVEMHATYSWWSTGLHCGMSTWWATRSSLACLFVCLLVGWLGSWLQSRCLLFFTSLITKTSSGSPKGLILICCHEHKLFANTYQRNYTLQLILYMKYWSWVGGCQSIDAVVALQLSFQSYISLLFWGVVSSFCPLLGTSQVLVVYIAGHISICFGWLLHWLLQVDYSSCVSVSTFF